MTAIGNVQPVDSTTAIGRDIEQLAVERYRTTLRECVKSLPVSDDDGLWIKTQVLRFLNATTVSELKEAVPAAFLGSPTAAAAFNSSEQSDLEPVA